MRLLGFRSDPRDKVLRQSQARISEAIESASEEFDLSDGELLTILAKELDLLAKDLRSEETD